MLVAGSLRFCGDGSRRGAGKQGGAGSWRGGGVLREQTCNVQATLQACPCIRARTATQGAWYSGDTGGSCGGLLCASASKLAQRLFPGCSPVLASTMGARVAYVRVVRPPVRLCACTTVCVRAQTCVFLTDRKRDGNLREGGSETQEQQRARARADRACVHVRGGYHEPVRLRAERMHVRGAFGTTPGAPGIFRSRLAGRARPSKRMRHLRGPVGEGKGASPQMATPPCGCTGWLSA